MRRPRSKEARRRSRVRSTQRLLQVLDLLSVIDAIDASESPRRKHRSTLMPRERRPWALYIQPMLGDNTFKGRFRMEHDDFMALVELLRPSLKRDERMGALRNGAIPVEYQVALTLRWLAGGSIYESMDGHVVSRSAAYQTAQRVVKALNECEELDCKWPEGEDAAKGARAFKARSSFGVMNKCVGAMDGLFIRMKKPSINDATEPNLYFSGHKKGYGMNFQGICDAQYRIIAWTMNCPGSQNDRTAFKFSGFYKVLKDLLPGHFILGDAAYPASDDVLVPFPGTALSISQDAFNFYQSQCRMAIEQTFGIMVRRWGILWRPMEVGLERFTFVVNAIVRLHNFCRERMVELGEDDIGRAQIPAGASITEDGGVDSGFLETEPPDFGRPEDDQVSLSGTREAIRLSLEMRGMGRPEQNLARNRSR